MSEAKKILENIIADFLGEKFIRFFREKSRQFVENGDTLSYLNDDNFSSGKKLGEIKFADGAGLVVCVFEVKNSLSERSGKKAQYEKAKEILKNGRNFSAGIFVFYDPAGNFRFSLVYPESIGSKRQWNNFRRFTYFVSPGLTNKTFKNQIGDGDFSTLEDIKLAFSVEKVTKEFFGEYKKLFEELVKDLNNNRTFKNEAARSNINTENFAKKLLGQIVFLYFLQKKRWLGAPQDKSLKQGDENFLQNLFDKKYIEYGNFFNDILEHLFYGALNKKSDKVGNFYRDYFKCQIPFLNGGLFEAEYKWEKTNIYLDDKIFARILEVFNRYNFTVDENSPTDQEVAIDPEMLGKVFENLLNENLRKGKGTYYTPREIVHYMCQESLINYLASGTVLVRRGGSRPAPANNPLLPKQEDITTLIKHNEAKDDSQIPKSISQNAKLIDKKLAAIKVCDPACGSGAFLVGMMNEIIHARAALTPYLSLRGSDSDRGNPETTREEFREGGSENRSMYNLKRNAIQNCIYGVDIDPGAIEIAKLRLWLSLVVDYGLEEIEPLPNLDYKIMQGNSLLEELVLGDTSIKLYNSKASENRKMKNLFEEDKQKDLFGETDKQEKAIENLIRLHKEYFEISDFEKKIEKKKEISGIEQDLIEKSVRKEIERIEADSKNIGKYLAPGIGMSDKDTAKFQKNLSKQSQITNVLNEFKKIGVKPFFLWRLYFADVFEKGGFDVVIANPPYIKEYTEKSAFDGLHSGEYYQGKMDLWYFFGAMGLDWLKDGGIETYISPNNWTTNAGASKFRNKIINDSVILTFLDFGNYKIFESAGIQTMVYVLRKNSKIKNYLVKYGKLLNDKVDSKLLEEFINSDFNIKNDKFVKYSIDFERDKFKDKNVIFLDNNLDEIFKKIKEQANFYLTEKEVAQGIVFPQDHLNKKNQQILGDSYKIGDGIFVLSGAEKNKLNLSEKELELIKPYYTTKQIHKWHGDSKNKEWIIYTDSKFKDPKNIKPYPNIKKHLDKFKKVITSDNRPYGLHRARDEKFFQGEKIIIARKCLEPQFCYTDFDCYVSATFYAIKTKRVDLKCLTALLNSKLIKFWLKNQGKMQGVNYQIDKEPLLNLPLKIIGTEQQKLFINLVDQILEKKKENPQADVGELEGEIDGMVYELYGLGEEEIGAVEGK